MNTSAKHELISIILNTGYADDVMAAARAAGAPEGTSINARGTGTEEDVKFFGLILICVRNSINYPVPAGNAFYLIRLSFKCTKRLFQMS
jgi:hypothetical protein